MKRPIDLLIGYSVICIFKVQKKVKQYRYSILFNKFGENYEKSKDIYENTKRNANSANY